MSGETTKAFAAVSESLMRCTEGWQAFATAHRNLVEAIHRAGEEAMKHPELVEYLNAEESAKS